MKTPLAELLAGSGKSAGEMIEQISHICRRLPPRSPGSAGEREAAAYMAGVLRKDCGCSNTTLDPFRVHPASFYGYCMISGILDSLSCLGFFLHPAFSLAAGCLSLLLFVFFFVLYLPILDPFFPAKESVNVTAVRPCSGETRRRVFLSGHIDAAWEFTLNYHFGGVVFEIPNVMALIGVLFNIAVSVCALCGAGAWTETAARWGILFLPFYAAVGMTFNPKRVVDGANDNLTGCFMGIILLREMERRGIRLENTEVGVILTGSEEAGLRGATAWCRKHGNDCRDVPTCIISFDTIHDPQYLMVNEKDLNGTVKADAVLSRVFLKAAEEVSVPCGKGRVPLFGGATDSAAFTQGGFRSVGITGLNHRLEDYYHTRRDSADNLDAVGLENCYRATVRLLELIDRGALDENRGENAPYR